ncbi:diguanylate cyclase [Fulvimarina sp. 2208YS6-2-32]|uniref:Diguanylate cyclase n=1 Tax=Fulvimarina uroteuthidis TaxID=3098149 RepID=A0ABU5I6Q8_9HYPH|nr:diguanylate cyclase [Fulvimarina sp. 2208YS6-2-32]MDY8109821.1 diguanylate cyclase [Fulvimarina sp. 2208YS6-2-32]
MSLSNSPSYHAVRSGKRTPDHSLARPSLLASLIDRARGWKVEFNRKNALIQQQKAELARSRKIFDRASEAARIGVWECELSDCSLRWTDVVYDIFELPRGSALDRSATLQFYPEASRARLEDIRSRAIAEKTGFTHDALITTANGNKRWIRITASVECEDGEPVRIFGMKQDITAEKTAVLRLRHLADFDSLTGLASRSRFQTHVAGDPDGGMAAAPLSAIVLIDLDRFKAVNDEFGHVVGDECLQETGRRLALLEPRADLLARIGGDEFAAVFGPAASRETVGRFGESVVRIMRRPIQASGHSIGLGASVGIVFSSDAADYARADAALYRAKAAGRGTVCVFGEEETSRPAPGPVASKAAKPGGPA